MKKASNEITLITLRKIMARNALSRKQLADLMDRLDAEGWEFMFYHFHTMDKERIKEIFCESLGGEAYEV